MTYDEYKAKEKEIKADYSAPDRLKKIDLNGG